MQYLRDCKDTKDFEEHFLRPFVDIKINDYKRILLTEIEKQFGDNKEMKTIINFIIKFNN